MEISKRHLRRLVKKQTEVYVNSLNGVMEENIQRQPGDRQSSCAKRTAVQDPLDEAKAGDPQSSCPKRSNVQDPPDEVNEGDPQSSCAKRTKVQDELDEVKEELAKIKEFVRGKLEQMEHTQLTHNKAIMAALAEQKVVMQKLVRQESVGAPMAEFFPLKYEQDMKNIEEKIMPDNREMYVTTIKRKLQQNAIRNLKNIFSDEVILSHNVDGTHGKKCIKSYKQFYAALLDAISQLPNVDGAEEHLRKAIQMHKKRIQKRISSKNTCLSKADPPPQSPLNFHFLELN